MRRVSRNSDVNSTSRKNVMSVNGNHKVIVIRMRRVIRMIIIVIITTMIWIIAIVKIKIN